MLLILVLIAWLAIMIVCAAICAMAARGDSTSIVRDSHSRGEGHGATAHGAQAAFGENPLELLLADERGEAPRSLTARGVR